MRKDYTQTRILAGIDVGTNAVRLLINNIEGNISSPDFKKVVFLRVPIRLGEDVFSKGNMCTQNQMIVS